jgi:hypothetical protein
MDISVSKQDIVDLVGRFKTNNALPNVIQGSSLMTKEDIILLSSITGTKILDTVTKHDGMLITLFQNVFLSFRESEITKDNLESIIQKACNVTLSSDGHPIPYGKALRLLAGFDWNFLQMRDVKTSIDEIRKALPIKQNFYHLLSEDDFHFYMVQINDSNANLWKEWAEAEEELTYSESISKAQKSAVAGIEGFLPSLKYYDNNATETWVAFTTNALLENPTIPATGSIEMCVTMMTSTHSPFTTHIGIFRAPSYQGISHKELAIKLHSFVAKTTLLDHNGKEFMITTPTYHMKEILLKALEKKYGGSGFVFIGDDHTEYPTAKLDDVILVYDKMKQSGYDKSERVVGDNKEETLKAIEACAEELTLVRQRLALEQGKLHCPFKTKLASSGTGSVFIIKNENDIAICTLKDSDMHGEFAWFFDSSWLYDSKDDTCSLVTTKLSELADLVPISGDIEHNND